MFENNSKLPDAFREIVYSNDESVPNDIQEIRNKRIILFYSLLIENAESEKEVWDIISCFMKIHKKDIDELTEIIDFAYKKASNFQNIENAEKN